MCKQAEIKKFITILNFLLDIIVLVVIDGHIDLKSIIQNLIASILITSDSNLLSGEG